MCVLRVDVYETAGLIKKGGTTAVLRSFECRCHNRQIPNIEMQPITRKERLSGNELFPSRLQQSRSIESVGRPNRLYPCPVYLLLCRARRSGCHVDGSIPLRCLECTRPMDRLGDHAADRCHKGLGCNHPQSAVTRLLGPNSFKAPRLVVQ